MDNLKIYVNIIMIMIMRVEIISFESIVHSKLPNLREKSLLKV